MHLAGLPGLDDDSGAGPQTLADQVMVHRRCPPANAWYRHVLGRDRAIRQDQDVVAGEQLPRSPRGTADPAPGPSRPHPPRPARWRSSRIGAEGADQALDPMDLFRSPSVRIGCETSEPVMRPGPRAPNRFGRGPDHRDQRHHQLLADSGSIGGLVTCAKILLEVIIEQLRLVRQRGNRSVRAHRPDWVLRIARHRLEEEPGYPPGCSQKPAAG